MRRRSTRSRILPAVCLSAALGLAHSQIPAATLKLANAELQAGEADKALATLAPLPSTGSGADKAQNLLCRVRFMLQQWSQATSACQKAVNLGGQDSDYHMWLGRALGQQASHSNFFSAYGLAKRSLSEMQAAVKLNPQNGPALSDLGDYYADAPGIAGGGTDKAQAVALQLDNVDSARAQQLRGDIAVAKKDYITAENDYRQAVIVSPHPAHQWTVLASFYRDRQRWPDMETAIQNCISAAANDKNSGIALYDGAGVLIAARRDPALAAQMLEDYLAGSSITEEGPAFIAHIRLGRLKRQLGDVTGARSELAIAASMAREFTAAQESKH